MGYYLRVFCKSDSKPKVKQILDHINGLSSGFKTITNLTPGECDSNSWTEFELKYKSSKLPISIEYNQVSGASELAKEEIQEFIEEIGAPGLFSIKKKKIIKHLRETKYIVASQLLSDIDDDGYNANGEFLKYFVNNYEGLIHADGEGFYSNDKIILETE